MKKLLAILLVFLLLTGCAQQSPGTLLPGDEPNTPLTPTTPDGSTIYSLAYYPDRSLNPFESTDYTNRVLFSLIYQGLFTVDSKYTARPILCHTYSVSADMRTWTFNLANASFSDGTAVTPEDVAASLTAAKGSAWYGNRLQHVKKITAGTNCVVLQLDTPYENLPLLLDIPVVKAAQVADPSPLGTGPYRLDGNQLRRQAGWWCSAELPVNLTSITLVPAENEVHIRNDFETGSIGLVCADPGSKDYVDFRSDCELWDCENGLFLYMTTNKNSKVFANENLRKALTHAIDRDMLVNTYYHGLARSATLPASPQFPYYSEKLAENYGYDPQKFADAVTEAALEDNKVTLLVSTSDYYKRYVAQEIANALKKAGLAVTVKEVAAEKLLNELRWGTWDLFVGQTRLSANMDLSAFFVKNGALNYGNLTDDGIYAMCKDALANTGNYYDLHKLVMESGRLCPILFQSYAVYGKRGVAPKLTPARDALFYYDPGRTLADARVSA